MKNRIIRIDQKNANKILLSLRNDPNTFCVEIEGVIVKSVWTI